MDEFEEKYTYHGDDLGAVWSRQKTTFRVWAPTADRVQVNLYEEGEAGKPDLIDRLELVPSEAGTWITEKTGDLNGIYYTYSVTTGEVSEEAVDPYARSTGVNGNRGMILNLASTDPQGWEQDKRQTLVHATDAIIYELHIRDFSIDESSGIQQKGKYLAFTESNTKTRNGGKTGVDYIKDLGVTHIQLLPSFDYGSVDESVKDSTQYNWGYDPQNYNVPEGSYSSDPYHGEVRVNEYKRMVQALHNHGLGVVMDVVYNHTYNLDFCYNKIVPGYFYRQNEDGSCSDGSGCGNDVATERSMVRKFIVDSVVYWAKEYHIDGFRFDLVGLMDTETMNEIRKALDKIDPFILMYGEGWNLQTVVTRDGVKLATQMNAGLVPRLGMFNDQIRDGLKGSVFEVQEKGYVNGARDKAEIIKDAVLGSRSWSTSPTQTVNYTSCHDNNTLWDKIVSSNPEDCEEDQMKQNLLAAAIVFTSQGMPFIQAGEEMLRTKVREDGTFDSNSFISSDAVNSIKWNRTKEYEKVVHYYKGLMALRKQYKEFRMTTTQEVKRNLTFLKETEENVIAYTIEGESSERIMVVYNPNRHKTQIPLPKGTWKVYVKGETAGTEVLDTLVEKAEAESISCMVLIQKCSYLEKEH